MDNNVINCPTCQDYGLIRLFGEIEVDTYTGEEIEINDGAAMICSDCNGKGTKEVVESPECNGTGSISSDGPSCSSESEVNEDTECDEYKMYKKFSKRSFIIDNIKVDIIELTNSDNEKIIAKAVVDGIGDKPHALRDRLFQLMGKEWSLNEDIALGDIDRGDEITLKKYKNRILPLLSELETMFKSI